MKKSILAVSAALVLALGIANAQTTLLVAKAKAGQTTYVEIAQLYADDGDLSSVVKLIGVRGSDSSTDVSDRYQALDEGIPGGWKVYISSSHSMAEEVVQAGVVENILYNNYLDNTYGISIPAGVAAGQYSLQIKVRDYNTGDVSLIPITVEVEQ